MRERTGSGRWGWLRILILWLWAGTVAGQETPWVDSTDTPSPFEDLLTRLDKHLAVALADSDYARANIYYDSLDQAARKQKCVALNPRGELACMALFSRWEAIADSFRLDPFHGNSDSQIPKFHSSAASAQAQRLAGNKLVYIRRQLAKEHPPDLEQIDRLLYVAFPPVLKEFTSFSNHYPRQAFILAPHCPYPDTVPCLPNQKGLHHYQADRKSYRSATQGAFPTLERCYGKRLALDTKEKIPWGGLDLGAGPAVWYLSRNAANPALPCVQGIGINIDLVNGDKGLGTGFDLAFFSGHSGTALQLPEGILQRGAGWFGWYMDYHYNLNLWGQGYRRGGLKLGLGGMQVRLADRGIGRADGKRWYSDRFTGPLLKLTGFYEWPLAIRPVAGDLYGCTYHVLLLQVAPELGFILQKQDQAQTRTLCLMVGLKVGLQFGTL